MNEEENYMYLYALDKRILEFEEEKGHLESGTSKPLLSTVDNKIAWEQVMCPLCWINNHVECYENPCNDCAAGPDGDGFCKTYVGMEEVVYNIDTDDIERIQELRDAINWIEKHRKEIADD